MTQIMLFLRVTAAAYQRRIRWSRNAQRPLSPRRSRALGPGYRPALGIRPAATLISPPRVCAGRMSVQERIRRYYEDADAPIQGYLWSMGWPSGLESAL